MKEDLREKIANKIVWLEAKRREELKELKDSLDEYARGYMRRETALFEVTAEALGRNKVILFGVYARIIPPAATSDDCRCRSSQKQPTLQYSCFFSSR